MKAQQQEQIKKEIINSLTLPQKKFVESGVVPVEFNHRGSGVTYAMAARLVIACIDQPFSTHLWLTERPRHCQNFFAKFLKGKRIPFTWYGNKIKLDYGSGIATVQFTSIENRKELLGATYKSVHCDPQASTESINKIAEVLPLIR